MLHAVGMGQACVQRWKDSTVYPKEADGGAEMLDTYTKPDVLVIPGSSVMSFLIELQIKCNGNIRRKSSLDWKMRRPCKKCHLNGALGDARPAT